MEKSAHLKKKKSVVSHKDMCFSQTFSLITVKLLSKTYTYIQELK